MTRCCRTVCRAQSYADGFDKLREHGALDAELAAELGNVVRLRNRLTYGYGSMDFQRLWTEAPAGIDALERFAAAVAAYVPRSLAR